MGNWKETALVSSSPSGSHPWHVVSPNMWSNLSPEERKSQKVVAACTSREAAEAAARLLLWDHKEWYGFKVQEDEVPDTEREPSLSLGSLIEDWHEISKASNQDF